MMRGASTERWEAEEGCPTQASVSSGTCQVELAQVGFPPTRKAAGEGARSAGKGAARH